MLGERAFGSSGSSDVAASSAACLVQECFVLSRMGVCLAALGVNTDDCTTMVSAVSIRDLTVS